MELSLISLPVSSGSIIQPEALNVKQLHWQELVCRVDAVDRLSGVIGSW